MDHLKSEGNRIKQIPHTIFTGRNRCDKGCLQLFFQAAHKAMHLPFRSSIAMMLFICLLNKKSEGQERFNLISFTNGLSITSTRGEIHYRPQSETSSSPVRSTSIAASSNRYLLAPPVALKPKLRLFSAGIAVQHPLPISGQTPVAYGYKAGSLLADYIPSIWLRIERPKRWFFQGEFIYSAPQLVKEFAFSRQTKPDTGFSSIATILTMKKTFFHQIPLSFNYYLKSTWSLGAGAGYAWLQGAITQREVVRNTWQGQIVEESNIVPINQFTDSFLHRSHSFVLLQTEYKWKRLSAGIKYTRDLQSFITYTAPDGRLIDKKNAALSVVLRFRLWEQ